MTAKIPAPTVNDRAATLEQLPFWINAVNQLLTESHHVLCKANGWDLEPYEFVQAGKGRKYLPIWKCALDDERRSIFAFVRAADGAILKPASMKKPALNRIRGSIFDQDVSDAITAHGVRYLDDPRLKG